MKEDKKRKKEEEGPTSEKYYNKYRTGCNVATVLAL
jgi:hypothetical protein